MTLKFYNTLTNKKETFKTKNNVITVYSCGPTVYSYAHIGNFRSFILSDILRRYLEWKGYKVNQIMNITDVGHMTVDDDLEQSGEDKIEKSARERGLTPKEIADFYTMAFFEDITKLSLKKAYFYPRASDHIKEMLAIISDLLEKGIAYKRNGNVYFQISKFPDYGKLSGNTLKKLKAGKRVKVIPEKKSPHDFALWIRNPKHLMQWDAPWSKGYPGWHIECSAMSMKYLGDTIDIHTGGEDNIFPHHDCEIAQSQAFTGKKFVNYWLHSRHLFVDGKKMSKSLGNFYTLRDLIKKGHSPRDIRFLLISAQYRTKMNFTEDGLEKSKETLKTLDSFVSLVKAADGKKSPVEKNIEKTKKDFEKAMDDDLNTPKAISHLFEFMKNVNKLLSDNKISKDNSKEIIEFIKSVDTVLGLDLGKAKEWSLIDKAPEDVKELILERENAREKKDYKSADSIRDKLKKMGYVIEDSKLGPKWKRA